MHTSNTTGRTAGRYLRSLLVGKGEEGAALAFAESQSWSDKANIVEVLKATVGSLGSAGNVNKVQADFLLALRPYSILSRINARRVPIRTRVIAFGTGTRGYMVAEHKNIPISKAVLAGVTVVPRKAAAMTVVTDELILNATDGTDQALADDLAAAVGAADDFAFIDPGVTGSILNGASTAASAGTSLANVDTDLAAALALLTASGGSARNAVWVMGEDAATKLSLLRGSGGAAAFPDLGPAGGTLLQLPVLTSATVDGYLGLVDQFGVLLSEEERVEIMRSQNAMIQMSDAPTSYPNAPTTPVSLFQEGAQAMRAILHRGWYARSGAGVYITGGNY